MTIPATIPPPITTSATVKASNPVLPDSIPGSEFSDLLNAMNNNLYPEIESEGEHHDGIEVPQKSTEFDQPVYFNIGLLDAIQDISKPVTTNYFGEAEHQALIVPLAPSTNIPFQTIGTKIDSLELSLSASVENTEIVAARSVDAAMPEIAATIEITTMRAATLHIEAGKSEQSALRFQTNTMLINQKTNVSFAIEQARNISEQVTVTQINGSGKSDKPQVIAREPQLQIRVAPQSLQYASTPTIGPNQVPVFATAMPHEVAPLIANAGLKHMTSTSETIATANPSAIPSTRPAKTMEIQLIPRTLGVVEVKIANTNGQLRIQITTQTAEARSAILLEANALKEAIRSIGLSADDPKVTVQHQPSTDQTQNRATNLGEFQGMQFDQENKPEGFFKKRSSHKHEPEIQSVSDALHEEEVTDVSVREGLYY